MVREEEVCGICGIVDVDSTNVARSGPPLRARPSQLRAEQSGAGAVENPKQPAGTSRGPAPVLERFLW